MANQTVITSQRLWSEEVAAVAANDAMDSTAGSGVAQILNLAKPVIYEFAGGRRTFVQPDDIYA